MGGYWYGPGEPACQLLLNNVTPLSHFHNTHKHVHTHKHTLIPVANTNGWSLYIVVLWSSVNHAAACVSNVTRLAGKTVCLCVLQSQSDYHDIHESHIQYHAWSREGDKHCVSVWILILPASQSYKMLQYMWPTADKYTLIYSIS